MWRWFSNVPIKSRSRAIISRLPIYSLFFAPHSKIYNEKQTNISCKILKLPSEFTVKTWSRFRVNKLSRINISISISLIPWYFHEWRSPLFRNVSLDKLHASSIPNIYFEGQYLKPSCRYVFRWYLFDQQQANIHNCINMSTLYRRLRRVARLQNPPMLHNYSIAAIHQCLFLFNIA